MKIWRFKTSTKSPIQIIFISFGIDSISIVSKRVFFLILVISQSTNNTSIPRSQVYLQILKP